MKNIKEMTIQQASEYITKLLKCGYNKEYIQRIIKL